MRTRQAVRVEQVLTNTRPLQEQMLMLLNQESESLLPIEQRQGSGRSNLLHSSEENWETDIPSAQVRQEPKTNSEDEAETLSSVRSSIFGMHEAVEQPDAEEALSFHRNEMRNYVVQAFEESDRNPRTETSSQMSHLEREKLKIETSSKNSKHARSSQ